MAGKSFISVDGGLLRRLYVDEGLTSRQISERIGVGFKTILRRLKEFGIEARAPGPARHEKLRDAGWLRDQYEKQEKSTVTIASEIGASARVVATWLEAHGIQSRPKGNKRGLVMSAEARQRMSAAKQGAFLGEANPNWRGGQVHPDKRLRASYASKAWSEAVRNRDRQCVECGAGGKLHAHHVKPWRDHPDLRFDLNNGITLCPPCHQKVHGWRFPEWAYHGKSRTSARHPQG